jgi:hypothetical protein
MKHYWPWFLYSFASSCVFYFIPAYSYDKTAANGSSGRTDGLWASGFVSFTSMVIVHHVFMCLGLRNYTRFMSIIYIISFLLFFPLTVYFNDVIEGTQMYLTTFNDILREP